MGKFTDKYIVELVDTLNKGVEVVTPAIGLFESIINPDACSAKKRLVELKVSNHFYDMIQNSSTIKELDSIMNAASKANEEMEEAKAKLYKEIKELKDKANNELKETRDAFDKDMERNSNEFKRFMEDEKATFDFEKKQKELELDRKEKILTGELDFKNTSASKNIEYTQALVDAEKDLFNKEIARLTAQFDKDREAAEASYKADIANQRAIAEAEMERFKTTTQIAFDYDIATVEKKIYTEFADRITALQDELAREGLKDDIIARLEEEKAYFKSKFEEERLNSNSFGAKALDSALKVSEKSVDAFSSNLGKEQKAVTVNVDASTKKVNKKHQD